MTLSPSHPVAATDQTIVYRVIGGPPLGAYFAQKLELIACKAGGWRTYRILSAPMAGVIHKTRGWYAHTTPLGACLCEIRRRGSKMLMIGIDGTRNDRGAQLKAISTEIDMLTTLAEKVRNER